MGYRAETFDSSSSLECLNTGIVTAETCTKIQLGRKVKKYEFMYIKSS
jgi:hypothetical protein